MSRSPSHTAGNGVTEALEAYTAQAVSDLNLINTTLPKSIQAVYKDIAEKTVAQVVAGTKTSDRALNDTIMGWQKRGFTGFTDRAGRNWRADVYARTVIKSTTYKVYNEMRTRPADELGIDTFYYSIKATAREACAPIQAQIVTKGEARTEKGVKIYALSDYGWGKAGGCLGIHCGHYLTPFVVGVNDLPELPDHLKNLTPEQAEENARIEAKQRALERAIRDQKERLHISKQLGDEELITMERLKLRNLQGKVRNLVDSHSFLHRDYARERYYYNDDTVKKLYKTIDKRSKKEYSETLQNLGNRAPKSYSNFQALSRSEKDSLRYDNRIVNYFKEDLQEKLSDKQKQQAVEAYFNFKNDGIVFGDHAIARYVERMIHNDGTYAYNYDTVKIAFPLPPNYVSEQNGRLARYYNGILYITEPDTDIVVTMMKRKKLKGFKPL